MSVISVRELAEELNLSKQAVHKRINQLPSKLTPEKVDGAYELTEKIADEIRSMSVNPSTNNQPNNQPVDTPSTGIDGLNFRIEDLRISNSKLYEQMDKKDSQIESLQKLLDQQQQLTLQVNKQNEQLLVELDSYKDELTETNKERDFEEEDKENIQKQTNKWWKFW